MCAVPLRGYGFEIVDVNKAWVDFNEFPSPYGDVVLKYCTVLMFHVKHKEEFPSPCGDVVLKLEVMRS